MKTPQELAAAERKREDYLHRLESTPVVVQTTVETPSVHRRFDDLCKICFCGVYIEDHGTCRKCRTKMSRHKDLKLCRDKNLNINTHTTGSQVVDEAIVQVVGSF